MANLFSEITPEELAGKGNIGKPDTPEYTMEEMQLALDEIPREVIIPRVNAMVKTLNEQRIDEIFTPEDRHTFDLLALMLHRIDCGTFGNKPIDPLELHMNARTAHKTLVMEGNTDAVSAPTQTLEEHEKDPNAHGNMVADGNVY